jgi:hypothetical protein
MKTFPMPLNATLEMLSECCDIIHDYREAGCPGFPGSNPFYDRLRAVGVTPFEAVDILARTWDNTEENV